MTSDVVDAATKAKLALIRYPRFNELYEDIRLCQEMSRLAGEPSCMVLEGVTGAGKSKLTETYSQAFTRYETHSGTKVPVFYLETPSPVTVKGMAARMLEELGDPAAHRGTLWSMNSRLIQLIKACDVQLVILDDFHHLIDKETNRVLETVSDWLKVLIKETSIPYLVVGIEGSVEQILQANSQLSRLFAVRETLHPFRWDPADRATLKEFAAFVRFAEEGVGMSLSDELPRIELMARIHYATNGVVGNVMNLMRFAVLLARQEGLDTLTPSVLSRAYNKRLLKHVTKPRDPFIPNDEYFARLGTTPENADKQSKRRPPPAAQVLTTR